MFSDACRSDCSQAQEEAPTTIDGQIKGLMPGKHGIHIHVFGDFSDGFITGGGIFNPFGRNHGAPDDEERMVGDLGENMLSGLSPFSGE